MSKLSPFIVLKRKIVEIQYDIQRYYIGKVLTIIDASIADKEQRKGIKDLIHEAFSAKHYYNYSLWDMIMQFGKDYCPDVDCKREIFFGNPKGDIVEQTPTPPDYFKDCE